VNYDSEMDMIIRDYESERYGAAADIARMLIMYEEGGFYLDLDLFVNVWDNELLHYFDSIHWKNKLGFEEHTLNTYGFLIKPNHHEL
jgi:mannosyltransferase OCH1-like enzyme